MTALAARTAGTCFLCVMLIAAIARGANQERKQPSEMLGRLKHSHIALMPGWEPDNLAAFRPLRPSVVAWGNDPVHGLNDPRRRRERAHDYRKLGIKLYACSVWMLTATARVLHDTPEYQDAVCVDVAGERIVPPWLDSNHKGVRPYWGCTNHPLFRKQLTERVRAGIAGGGNMLHLDDHLGTAAAAEHAGGCFCEYCMKGFRVWLGKNLTKSELAKEGVSNIRDFDYRDAVRKAGFTTRQTYRKGRWQKKIPLRDEFLAFQRDAAVDFVKQLSEVAARAARRPVPVGVNSYNLAPTALATAHHADFFANEVQHYGKEDTFPPMAYLLGTALGKPVFSTASGQCWVKVQQRGDVTRVRRWIATAYAFGHYFMYAYKQWGFSKETGTRWYLTPISTYEPLCRFITDNAALFDDYEPVAQVGVLYDNRAARDNHWEARDLCRALHYANIPCGLAAAGDGWLRHRLSQDQLERFELVVIPKHSSPTGKQAALLKRWRQQGRAIAWPGLEKVRQRIRPLVAVTNAEKVWTLPRRNTRRPDAPAVIHLLNQDYDADTDTMRTKSNIEVSIAVGLTGGAPARGATLFAPGRKLQRLAVKRRPDAVTVTVPTLDLWAILRMEQGSEEGRQTIKHLPGVDASLDIGKVPAGFPVRFCLLTKGSRQYVAYYDSQRRMTVAARRLEASTWQYQVLPEKVGWDSHNGITMTVDDDGYLHLSGNMHCRKLMYFRTSKPWDITTFRRIDRMTGSNEARCTYPAFMRGARGELIFHYRDGGSGNGSEIYNVYDGRTKTWRRLLDTPLTDGQGKMNAYMSGPSRGPDGWFHLGWVWRDTPDCQTNHDPSYARSRDLIRWETIDGKPISLPITLETKGTLIDPVPAKGGIINGALRLGFDSAKRLLVSYHKFDENGNTQVYAARFKGGNWVRRKVTDWRYRWEFKGNGSIKSLIGIGTLRPHGEGKLALPYRHVKYGKGVLILDEETFELLGTARQEPRYPAILREPKSEFEGMEVRLAEDIGGTDGGSSRYVLRWETLSPNRDRAREGPLPKPGMLKLYRISSRR